MADAVADRVVVEIEAQVDGYQADIKQAVGSFSSGMREIENAGKQGEGAARSLGGELRNTASSMTLTRVQALELTHIARSLFDEISAGASPFRALAVESGRIGEVIGTSGGPLNALRGLATILGGPLVVGSVAAAAGLGVLAFAFSNAQSEAVKLQRALDITGNLAGVTGEDIRAMGAKIATASGTGTVAATELVEKLATSGKFTRDEIGQLAASAVGLSERTGESADKIIAAFIKAADGPTAYAREFASSFTGLTAATIEHIRQLEETGRKDEALQVLSENLYGSLGTKAPGQLGILERAWRSVTNAISGAVTAALQYGSVNTSPRAASDKRVADLRGRIDSIRNSPDYQRGNGDVVSDSAKRDYDRGYGGKPQTPNQQIAALQRQIVAEQAAGVAIDAHTKAQQQASQVQREGAAASKALADAYGSFGDNVPKANDLIQAFRENIRKALAANPKDPEALRDQANQKDIEADILRKNTPDTQRKERESKEAERQRAEAARKAAAEEAKQRSDDKSYDDAYLEAQQAAVRASRDRAQSIDEAAAIERDDIRLARERQRVDTAAAGVAQKRSAADTAALQAVQDAAAAEKIAAVDRKAEVARQRVAYEAADDALRLQQDAVSVQGQLATTADGRRDVARKLLALDLEELRLRTAAILKPGSGASPEEQARARAELAGAEAAQPAKVKAAERQTEGPGQSYIDTLPKTAGEIGEAFQGAAVDGLKAFDAGITDAILHAKSLGDVFHSVADTIIADLIRIAIEKEVIGPLASFLGLGDAGSSSGGIGAAISSVFHLGRAGGGDVVAGQSYIVGDGGGMPEVFTPSSGGSITPNRSLASMSGGGGVTVVQPVNIDVRGGILTPQLLQHINDQANAAAVRGAAGGAAMASANATRAAGRRLA